MCGIVGYIGNNNVKKILIEGLKKLEYRGYDSCGIAINLSNKEIYRKRAEGKVEVLEKILEKEDIKKNISGIAHTRWATHGLPNENNAHPHTDCKEEIVIVHNGIIENYSELKKELILKKHKFKSETDTEVIAHLIEEKLKEIKELKLNKKTNEPVFFEAFRRAINLLKGSFAISVLYKEEPEIIFSARMHSPLVVGIGEKEFFLASDVSAFIKYTKKVYFIEDGEMIVLRKDKVNFYNFKGKKIIKNFTTVNWDISMAEKGGYKHYMLKEINEQAISVENTLSSRLFPLEDSLLEKEIGITKKEIKNISQIQIIACGTAYHAGLIGKYLFEKFKIRTDINFSSEFDNRAEILDKNTLVIAVSQSGETADTLYAIKQVKKGNKILSITNTLGSSITRIVGYNLYTHCGPEIGVASTKAFLGQITAFYLLALNFAYIRGVIDFESFKKYSYEIVSLPIIIEKTLKLSDFISNLAKKYSHKEHYLFIARDINFPIALEGALKIKEISYVHAEGYAAGEMKHGPIAIIENGMPVLSLATSSKYLKDIASNIEEAKARGGEIIAIVDKESKEIVKAKHYIEVEKVSEIFSPMINVIPLQLFAYYIALERKCDIDKPRNLAKSVTVR